MFIEYSILGLIAFLVTFIICSITRKEQKVNNAVQVYFPSEGHVMLVFDAERSGLNEFIENKAIIEDHMKDTFDKVTVIAA